MKRMLNKNSIKSILLIVFVFLFSFAAHLNPVIPVFLTALYLLFTFSTPNFKNYDFTQISFLLLTEFAIGYFILKAGFNFYCLPILIVPMLAALLFNSVEIPFFLSLANSVTLASLTTEPFKAFLIFFISSIAAILALKGARRRSTIIHAGLISGILQLVTLILLESFVFSQPQRYVTILITGLLSGIIVLGVLPVFEYLLQTVTNISLLELADTHQPLLQRLVMEAPGTYHHSLIVGNLSETACNAVGANALLARIGAYYHDIGKLHKPEYFIENQDIQTNVHDALTPTISKLVIMNHVKEGIELAKKYRLSPMLWNFIQQHHGKSLVYYFYRRALEGKEEDQEVTEDGFRYPGPKPNSKETAIVLLADSVEAATRTLKEPTPSKIEDLVHRIINNKFIDGQLDECELTLKDIEKISGVFIKILGGIYHSRIAYQENQEQQANSKNGKS
ncbi:MAG: HDIG domain-containing protein [Candidatus Omnitrophica bacterium]|jgi:hypothetical protein|nr:HDIG domain-containing protein [Candidatus Omnitrophota bacterium]